ncbi:MAG: glutathione-regulated potassium-efflux system protein KefC [Myxococcales bacterium]|nr:glutathione-regulated potassium-efflux system protein KefC [Myxococcales bacterium]
MHERSLLTDAVVYLSAAVVAVPIFARLGLGSVLGYLAAGCLIGPYGLKLVEDVETILHFAEFGVVLMLFLIGLELEPSRLWQMRRAVFGGGALQMGLCGALLVLGALGVGLPWRAATLAGLALALSSTAIAVQTMKERGVLGSPMGRASFGILLFQDIAAIPLVGIVPLLAVEVSSHQSGGLAGLFKVLGAIFAVVVLGRYATRPALRLIANTHLRELSTAFALLLVVGIARVMERVGISMGLGAFLAGVLLAGSEYRHALETDIEPFKGLLMGLFFIAVGMSIDFALLRNQPWLVLGLVLGFTALKAGALYAVARLTKMTEGPNPQGLLFAAVMAQGGEFAFVIFGVARDARIMPGQWDKLLTLTVALSMAMTPLLVMAAEAWARRAGLADARPDDTIEGEDAPVIIAGFGRFGQIVGRLLFASGLRATVLDHDPESIEVLRRFGFRIFYGDATRLDLLEAAGAGRAKVLVNAIDDIETSLRLVDLVKHHFPQLKLVCRARNVTHWIALRERGVELIEREVFEGSLVAGRLTLESLGVGAHEAWERAAKFRIHNVASMEGFRTEKDIEKRRAAVRASRDQLEQQFERDRAELDEASGGHWHDDTGAPPRA